MEDVIAAIGPKLRQLRRQKSLSLQQLADRSGVSAAAIHKIERNGMVPTIATLMKLAQALNRPVAFFVDEDRVEPAVLVAARERKGVFTSKRGLVLESISGPYGRFLLAGAMATIEPGADSGPRAMEHPGEELVLVLQGSMEFEVEGELYRLRSGDAIHFRTDRPHRWRNPGARPGRAVWMALRQP
ncbi:MAG TPA: cupin domain-containing protein [Actinomycetota bacterium]|nr:cupin domain-containing protein [Actinomycetota bacterium]